MLYKDLSDDEDKKEEKPKGPLPIPFACIVGVLGFTQCGRDMLDNKEEFFFTDAAYAVKHYANGRTVKACADCVKEFNQRQAKEDMNKPTSGVQ